MRRAEFKIPSTLMLSIMLSFAVTTLSTASAGELPARKLFGAVLKPAKMAARSIGGYVSGCLAGGAMLPVDGPAWQAMRLSRNRNWGHPVLVNLVKKLATESKEKDGWPGLLIGDLAQPRGGPMISGHKSHQLGLDADIWLDPMPPRRLTNKEREDISATTSLAANKVSLNYKVWKPGHVTLIKRAASYPEVARIFVHPAIKKELCKAAGKDRSWLSKVRAWWGHHYHFHIRINCPKGSTGCKNQPAPAATDGCGKELAYWIKKVDPSRWKKPKPGKKPAKVRKRREIMMASLPKACRAVLKKDRPNALAADSVPLPVRKPI